MFLLSLLINLMHPCCIKVFVFWMAVFIIMLHDPVLILGRIWCSLHISFSLKQHFKHGLAVGHKYLNFQEQLSRSKLAEQRLCFSKTRVTRKCLWPAAWPWRLELSPLLSSKASRDLAQLSISFLLSWALLWPTWLHCLRKGIRERLSLALRETRGWGDTL